MTTEQNLFGAASAGSAQARRSQGQIVVARGLWHVKPGQCELQTERLMPPKTGEARVATLFSGISRGTERLVANGEIPESEWTRMRAPLQAGAFPYPVKYGYSATGVVTAGPDTLMGQTVFCLHPHQDYFQAPVEMLLPLPGGVPAKRATLAANMETALNAHWDAGTGPGDRVLVVGAGLVGLLVAHLAARIAGTVVTVTDIDAGQAAIAEALGLTFRTPDETAGGNTLVFHTSATGAGLETALAKSAFEGRIIELSWYGARPATIRLGGAFHSQRLHIISSQVGHVAPKQRGRMSHRDRLATALGLLSDDRLDALVSDEIPFDALPERLPQILAGTTGGITPVVRY